MRFLLCLIIWLVFVGGLYLYTSERDKGLAQITGPAPTVEKVMEKISIELTPTFSVEEDPFALNTGDAQGPFEVRLNNTAIDTAALEVGRGKTMVIRDIETALAAHNEVFVKLSPPISENDLTHGVRVHLMSGQRTLADETIWNSGGGLVSGTVTFSIQDVTDKDHDH